MTCFASSIQSSEMINGILCVDRTLVSAFQFYSIHARRNHMRSFGLRRGADNGSSQSFTQAGSGQQSSADLERMFSLSPPLLSGVEAIDIKLASECRQYIYLRFE